MSEPPPLLKVDALVAGYVRGLPILHGVEGRRTFDFEKRKNIYHRIHGIFADEQPYTFLYVPDALPVLHKRFKGVEKAPIGIWHDFKHWKVPKNKIEWYN